MPIESFQDVERKFVGLTDELIRTREDFAGMRVTLEKRLDTPKRFEDRLADMDARVDRSIDRTAGYTDYARNLCRGLVAVGVAVVVLAIVGWFLRQGTEGRVAETNTKVADVIVSIAGVRGDLGVVTSRVEKVERRMDRTEDHLASLERRVVGVRRLVGETVGRTGSLEDTQGVDHNKRLFRLPGFAPCKLDGETLVPATLTPAMKKELVKIVALTNTGWTVKEVLGFADETPFRRGGKILPNSDSLNGACATARATIVASHLGLSDITPAAGRGITTKFGGLDVNRSVLIYIERSAS